MIRGVRLRCVRHAGVRLGTEILDDDLLDVPIALVQIAQRQQCFDALASRLADPDQDAGGERDFGLAGCRDGGEPHGRHLVGRAEMGTALLRQTLRGGLQHDPLRHRDPAQTLHVVEAHDAGIEVGQEPGLLEHQLRHGGEIIERRGMAELVQRLARGAVAQLRLVAEREQRLAAAGARTGLRNRQHVFGCQIGSGCPPGRLREGAVVAGIAAELGERNEDFPGIRDVGAVAAIAQHGGRRHQRGKIIAAGERQRLRVGRDMAVAHGGEKIVEWR